MMKPIHRLPVFLFAVLSFSCLKSQEVSDYQWIGFQLNETIGDLSISYQQQIRPRYGFAILDEYFNQIGFRQKFNNKVAAGIDYRWSIKDPLRDWETGHRFNLDVQLRQKAGDFRIVYRPRIQARFSRGNLPQAIQSVWYDRHKFTFQYDLTKRFSPYLSYEMFHPWNPAALHRMDRQRFMLGADLDMKNRHGFNLFYYLELNMTSPERAQIHALGLIYNYELKLLGKRKKNQ